VRLKREHNFAGTASGGRFVEVVELDCEVYRGDDLMPIVIDAIRHVHRVLGPGFLEGIYQRALLLELRKRGVEVATERSFVVRYDNQEIGRHRLDMVVANRIIVELKTVPELSKAHYAQVRSYLRATGLPLALLVNFSKEQADWRRIEAA
jgi:GxxExxY protein